jgi:hypothetical protein
MPKLKDFMDEKGNFYEHPPMLVQIIEPMDYVSDQILEHKKYGYQLQSMTPIASGSHSGRMLLLFIQQNAAHR